MQVTWDSALDALHRGSLKVRRQRLVEDLAADAPATAPPLHLGFKTRH
jgi:hypothetical protein